MEWHALFFLSLAMVGCGDSASTPTPKPSVEEDAVGHGIVITGPVFREYPAGTAEFVNGLLERDGSDMPRKSLREVIAAIGKRNQRLAELAGAFWAEWEVPGDRIVPWVRIRDTKESNGKSRIDVGIRVPAPKGSDRVWIGTGIEEDSGTAKVVFTK